MKDPVALLKFRTNPEKTLEMAIELIDSFRTLRSPVLIKPNICTGVDKTGFANTKLEIIESLMRLLPQKKKIVYHPHINELIVDLNRIVTPDLCIIDARVGLEGWGGPKKRQMNALIVGAKPVSVDATLAQMMGFPPDRIRHLVEAEKYDLGSLHPIILGENPALVSVKFNLPPDLSPTAFI